MTVMTSIQTTLTVRPDGTAVCRLPASVPAGDHSAVVTLKDDAPAKDSMAPLPLIEMPDWPADLSLHREDMYGDDGR
jgi:hypothetical protein